MCVMGLAADALADDGQVWWGYWNTSMNRQTSGNTVSGTVSCALRLTSANALLVDGQVWGLRFYLTDKSVVGSASIWVSVKQFSGADGPDTAIRQIDLRDLRDLSHDGEPTVVYFDEPVSVLPATNRYASAYVGYTIEATAPTPLVSAGSDVRIGANTCFVNWQNQEAKLGPLAMQLLVSGPNMPRHAITVGQFDEQLLPMGTTATVSVPLQNVGWEPVRDVDVQVSFDGAPQPVQHISLDTPVDELEATFTLPLPIQLPAIARRFDCTVAVTAVNGSGNASAAPASVSSITGLSQMPLKRSVMEELTGTWCPNCPRGMVGLRVLEELFGDRFVGIAVHGGDASEPMRLPNYDGSQVVSGISKRMGGRPSCSVDRTVDCDPYGGLGSYWIFGADAVVGYMLQQPTMADLDVTARWTDERMTQIDCDVTTTFRFGADQSDYALMLVLTADSLTGEGRDWQQVNTLAGKTEYEAYCDEFVYGDYRMNIKYNHVPIWADGVEKGIAGSITAPLVADAPQHYRRTVSLSEVPLSGVLTPLSLQHLHAVALLLDNATGQVVNAVKAGVAGGANALPRISRPVPTGARSYLPDGRLLNSNRQHGLVIVRQADGSIRKMLR